jgi:hypothetical protein
VERWCQGEIVSSYIPIAPEKEKEEIFHNPIGLKSLVCMFFFMECSLVCGYAMLHISPPRAAAAYPGLRGILNNPNKTN